MGDEGFHSGEDFELVVGVKVGKMGKVGRIREYLKYILQLNKFCFYFRAF